MSTLKFFPQGLGKEYLFSHHQKAYEGNRISWYDQQFNKREITESKLPPLRSWDRQKLAWAPEKSDYPIQGCQSLLKLLYACVVLEISITTPPTGFFLRPSPTPLVIPIYLHTCISVNVLATETLMLTRLDQWACFSLTSFSVANLLENKDIWLNRVKKP